jgi:hypothetical protein
MSPFYGLPADAEPARLDRTAIPRAAGPRPAPVTRLAVDPAAGRGPRRFERGSEVPGSRLSTVYAPAKGVVLGGQFFQGGELLPRELLEPLTGEQRRELEAAGLLDIDLLTRLWEAIHTAEAHERDLARAGIPRQDARGRWADFHSFRYTFCTWMAQRHPIQVVQRLMRHGTITLTTDLYNDLDLSDTAEELWTLPPLTADPLGTPAVIRPEAV